jgi:hypothetical protein
MSPIDVTTTNQNVEVSTTGQTVGATVSGGHSNMRIWPPSLRPERRP